MGPVLELRFCREFTIYHFGTWVGAVLNFRIYHRMKNPYVRGIEVCETGPWQWGGEAISNFVNCCLILVVLVMFICCQM